NHSDDGAPSRHGGQGWGNGDGLEGDPRCGPHAATAIASREAKRITTGARNDLEIRSGGGPLTPVPREQEAVEVGAAGRAVDVELAGAPGGSAIPAPAHRRELEWKVEPGRVPHLEPEERATGAVPGPFVGAHDAVGLGMPARIAGRQQVVAHADIEVL